MYLTVKEVLVTGSVREYTASRPLLVMGTLSVTTRPTEWPGARVPPFRRLGSLVEAMTVVPFSNWNWVSWKAPSEGIPGLPAWT